MCLFVLIVNGAVAFVGTDTTNFATPTGCYTVNNATNCQNVSKTTFLSTFFSTTVSGISGAPAWFNVFYVGILLTILAGGIILMVLGVIGFTAA